MHVHTLRRTGTQTRADGHSCTATTYQPVVVTTSSCWRFGRPPIFAGATRRDGVAVDADAVVVSLLGQLTARRLLPASVGLAATAATCAGISFAARDDSVSDRLASTARAWRTVAHGAHVAVDYKLGMWLAEWTGTQRDTEEWKGIMSRLHARSAKRLLTLCEENGGVYTKWGQYIGSMSHVLPSEYTTMLSVLQDSVAPRPWQDMKAALEAELGVPVEDVFFSIAPEPIAAASLAQVHRARTHAGEEVAVKVQYPGLPRQVEGDIWTMRVLADAIGRLFPSFQFSWMLPEFEDNLRDELDFRREAANAAEISSLLADRPDVYIPRTVDALTTAKVHTMEYVQGVKVTDRPALEAMGVQAADVAEAVSSTFGEMTFCHGFVHCDPHPGNLMVRLVDGKPQLVVLDHGMYRRLDPAFRGAYCRLWQALILRDNTLLLESAHELGIGQYAELLPFMFSYKAAANKAKMGGAGATKPDERVLGRKYTMSDINHLFESLPRDMLFVLRTLDLSRSVNMALGGTSRQRFRVNASCAIKGLSLEDPEAAARLQANGVDKRLSRRARFKAAVKRRVAMAEMKARVWFIDLVFSWIWWWHALRAPSPP